MPVTVAVDGKQAHLILNRLTAQLMDLTPILGAMAQYMVGSVRRTIMTGGLPGAPFAPLSPLTLASRRHGGSKPLFDDGSHLAASIHVSRVTPQEAEVSAGWEYAHVHQYGMVIEAGDKGFLAWPQRDGSYFFCKRVTIPARPFMGFRPEDPAALAALGARWLESMFGGVAKSGTGSIKGISKGLGL